MKFSYDAAWNDVRALWRAHGEVLPIVAGLFLMVPDFARNLFLPLPAITGYNEASIQLVEAYFNDNATALFLLNLPILIGSAAILAMMVDPRRLTVGEALKLAFLMLPSIFVLNFLIQFGVLAGLALFVVPGLYIGGRFAVATSWQIAHRNWNPLKALAISFDLTRGNGWRIAGIIVLFWVVGFIMTRGIGAILGVMIAFVIPEMSLAAVSAFLQSILSTCFFLALLVLAAAIYRQVAPSPGK